MADNLRIGQVFKSVKSFKGIKYRKCGNSFMIPVRTKSGRPTEMSCYKEMLDTEYVYTGRNQPYEDALCLSELKNGSSGWTVPMAMLEKSTKRIIDIRKIESSSLGLVSDEIFRAIQNRCKNSTKLKLEDYRKLNLKWFLNRKLTTKKIICEAIKVYNKYGRISCPNCNYGISTDTVYHTSYIRSNKIFIQCPDCGFKSYIVSEHYLTTKQTNPFCLCPIGE